MRPPRPGDPAPPFQLDTPWGVPVSLAESILRGPVVLEFIRGTWDPSSRSRLEELAAHRGLLEARRARLLAITCEPAREARAFLEHRGTPLALLLDPQRRVARAYSVFRRFSFGAFSVARPATFVVDRCGFVRYAHAARTPIDAAPVAEILEVLERLEAEGRPRRRAP